MTELERLKEVRNQTFEQRKKVEGEISLGYESIIRKALEKIGFDMNYFKAIYCSPTEKTPVARENSWASRYDYVRVDIEDSKGNGHELTLCIDNVKVRINNCCTGDWTKDSWYYHYVKAMAAIADETENLIAYCVSIDRTALEADLVAASEVEHETTRLRTIEREQKEAEKLKAMEAAEWLGVYGYLKSYEDGYIQGAKYEDQPRVLRKLYKVVRRTNKLIYLLSYYSTSNPTVFEKPWYGDTRQYKKAEVYSLHSCYEAVDPSTFTIKEDN